MSDADVQNTAIKWLADLESTDHPEEIWPSLRAWIAANPAHLSAFCRVERLWRIVLAALRARDPESGAEEHSAFLQTLDAELAACPTLFAK